MSKGSSTVGQIEYAIAGTGRRLTGPRRVLAESLLKMGDHFAAEELLQAAPGVGRATVFRTLRMLQESGLVCQVVMDDGRTVYRLGADEHHHHVVCSQCGAVADVVSTRIEKALGAIAIETGYEVDAHRLELYGRCPDCRAGAAGATQA